jgi:high affinity Mn2+ porin
LGAVVKGLLGATLALTALSAAAQAADMPVKAPPAAPGWDGFYVGSHFGYAAGTSDWSATGVPPGSFTLFNGYDPFKGTGSYFAGLQAGYNYVLPSRLMVGIEADISFPNSVRGSALLFSPAIGQSSFAETAQMFGTLRGRVGYTMRDWLLYATAGLAWSYDEFARTQIAGMPIRGIAAPGDAETLYKTRLGWAAGVGVEMPVAPHWTAKFEYLFTGFGTHAAVFPASAQSFTSDLAIHSVRAGLNYQLSPNGDASKGVNAPEPEGDRWAFRAQTTYLHQFTPRFRSPYTGTNSLLPNQGRETWDVTLYAGLRLWSGAEVWVNPEIDQGFGLSNTLGVAGFTSGEAYKVGASVPYARIPRMFVRQTINLGGSSDKVEGDINQFAGTQTADRLVFTVGKFAVTDVFDTNKYAHDPRKDFMNWAIVDTGTFDYAADAWGYTYGAAAEWYQGPWTARAGIFDLSIVPNSTELDPTFRQFQMIGEIERRYELWGRPGKVAVTGFLMRGRMGSFADAINLAAMTGDPADTALVRRYRSRSGLSVNAEQQVTDDIGVFARAGIASGNIEPYEFSDIDRTVAAGATVSGKKWGRPDDAFGIAGVANGISKQHEAYFNAGGLGILVGDGQLPNPGGEYILETFYSFPIWFWRATLDYQLIVNPAYNRDRGPVSVFGTRLRAQF